MEIAKRHPSVPEMESVLLEKSGFSLENSCEMYLDFKRYHSTGWGEDGTDRVECISLDLESQRWYATSTHRDLDGVVWYENDAIECNGTLESAIKGVELDRFSSPKQMKDLA